MEPGAAVEIPQAREIVPNVNRISAAVRAAGGLNVLVRYLIDDTAIVQWSTWFTCFATPERRKALKETFCRGCLGFELWPELDVQAKDLVVDKTRFGAFVSGASDLHEILQARRIDGRIDSASKDLRVGWPSVPGAPCERSGGNGSSAGPFRRQSEKRKNNNVLCRFSPIAKRSFIDSGFCDVADLRLEPPISYPNSESQFDMQTVRILIRLFSELLCYSSNPSIPAKQTSFIALRQRDPEFGRVSEHARLGIAKSPLHWNGSEPRHQCYRRPVDGGLDG
jgi:hypothetical protein